MIAELQQLGLSGEEAKVYLACLEINGGPVSVIAKRAGVHRVGCYHTIENLVKKRLLSQYDKNGTRCFAPEKPEQLLRLEEEKMNMAKMLIPQLTSLQSILAFQPKIRFYEGESGVKKIFADSLLSNTEIVGYTNLQNILNFSPVFFRDYIRTKLEKGIKTRYLSPNTVGSVQEIKSYLPVKFDPNLLEILLVNKDQFLFENEILIFGNSVGIVSLKKEELLGLMVESPTFARTMKAIFDLAWLGATAFVAQ